MIWRQNAVDAPQPSDIKAGSFVFVFFALFVVKKHSLIYMPGHRSDD
jgi:hypothetical protein